MSISPVNSLAFSTLFAGAMLVSGLPVSAPADAADRCLDVRLACSGFEPGWQFITQTDGEGDGTVTFTDPESPDGGLQPIILEGCVLSGAEAGSFQILSGAPVDLEAQISPIECVEPNDTVRTMSVDVLYNQGASGQGMAADGSRISGTGCCFVIE